jgi:hypothetical protein
MNIAERCLRPGRREHQLKLARIAPPRGQQPIGGKAGGGIVGAADHRLAVQRPVRDLLPQRRRRVQEEQVDVALLGDRAEHLQVAGR